MKYIEELFALETAVIKKEAEYQEVIVPLKHLKKGHILTWYVNSNTVKLRRDIEIQADKTVHVHFLKKEIIELLGVGISNF